MSEVGKVLEFVRRFYRETGSIPSVRRICRETNLTPPRFYRLFGSLKRLCTKAGLKIDDRTKERMKISAKATRKHVKRAIRKTISPLVERSTVESADREVRATTTFEQMQEDLATEQKAHESLKARAQQVAKEMKTLALNNDPKISQPILEAFSDVMPTILLYKFGVKASIPDLVKAQETLRLVQNERKKLQDEQLHVEGMKKECDARASEIQLEREKIKMERAHDPEKDELRRHIDKLEAEKEIANSRLSELFVRDKNLRIISNCLIFAVSECSTCSARFQRYMEPYKDIQDWLTSGKLVMTSFETMDISKQPSQT